MREIKRILCPTDFSDASRHALDHAVVLARWYRASLVGLHVYNPLLVPVPSLALPEYGEIVASDAPDAGRLRTDMADWFQPALAAGIDVDVLVEAGPTTSVILNCEKTAEADLIVIGTHGAGGFEYPLLGSVTEKVLRKARCPVLTVPPRAGTVARVPFRKLLCATDFSDPAMAAAEYTLSLAREADAAVTLLHVVEWPETDSVSVNAPYDVPEYKRLREAAARRKLERLVPDDARNWCTPTLRIGHGKAYREILNIAAEDEADLIVLGVHGRPAIDLLFFGSTTNQVVRHATCPVLTVRR